MRFGRFILASLTALAAYSYAQAEPKHASADSPRLFQAVAPFLVTAGDSAAPAQVVKPAAQVWFTLEALCDTPLAGSLCLIASFVAIDLVRRRHQKNLLRC